MKKVVFVLVSVSLLFFASCGSSKATPEQQTAFFGAVSEYGAFGRLGTELFERILDGEITSGE
jgi:hypothetical protein